MGTAYAYCWGKGFGARVDSLRIGLEFRGSPFPNFKPPLTYRNMILVYNAADVYWVAGRSLLFSRVDG